MIKLLIAIAVTSVLDTHKSGIQGPCQSAKWCTWQSLPPALHDGLVINAVSPHCPVPLMHLCCTAWHHALRSTFTSDLVCAGSGGEWWGHHSTADGAQQCKPQHRQHWCQLWKLSLTFHHAGDCANLPVNPISVERHACICTSKPDEFWLCWVQNVTVNAECSKQEQPWFWEWIATLVPQHSQSCKLVLNWHTVCPAVTYSYILFTYWVAVMHQHWV